MSLQITPSEVASVTMLLSGSNELRETAKTFASERPVFEPLDWLDRVSSSVRTLQLELAKSVETARAAGHSWTEIGQALRISKQAAQQRYGG